MWKEGLENLRLTGRIESKNDSHLPEMGMSNDSKKVFFITLRFYFSSNF